MKKELLKIINHYGVSHQLRKLNEECYELLEAINDYEWMTSENGRCDTQRIAEEMADVHVMLAQFAEYYNIDSMDIAHIMAKKIKRQLGRMENE